MANLFASARGCRVSLLNAEQLRSFEERGYLALESVYEEGAVEELRAALEELRGDDAASQRDEVLAQERVLVESAGARDFRNGPGCEQTTLQEDVTWELGRLSHAGMEEVLTVDLTKREFGIPVVRVVIPGLEGSHEVPGYVPGERALRQQGRR